MSPNEPKTLKRFTCFLCNQPYGQDFFSKEPQEDWHNHYMTFHFVPPPERDES